MFVRTCCQTPCSEYGPSVDDAARALLARADAARLRALLRAFPHEAGLVYGDAFYLGAVGQKRGEEAGGLAAGRRCGLRLIRRTRPGAAEVGENAGDFDFIHLPDAIPNSTGIDHGPDVADLQFGKRPAGRTRGRQVPDGGRAVLPANAVELHGGVESSAKSYN